MAERSETKRKTEDRKDGESCVSAHAILFILRAFSFFSAQFGSFGSVFLRELCKTKPICGRADLC
jgi:hypothetical protein